MKPWIKKSLNSLWVFGTAGLVAFFTLVVFIDYMEMGGHWLKTIPMLVASSYGIYSFIKKFKTTD